MDIDIEKFDEAVDNVLANEMEDKVQLKILVQNRPVITPAPENMTDKSLYDTITLPESEAVAFMQSLGQFTEWQNKLSKLLSKTPIVYTPRKER